MKSIVTKEEALAYMSLPEHELAPLFERAQALRKQVFQNRVRLCAISNAKSGACSEKCDFCSQSAHFKTEAPVFKLKKARQIADEAKRAEKAGAREFSIVTSGRGIRKEADIRELEEAIRLIRKETDLEVCASLGEVDREILKRFKDAGLMRYHHNIETAPSFHSQIVHTHSYQDELNIVLRARELGLSVCCGGIFGMGETPAQRVEMAFALKELNPECVPLNFLNPRPGTPLENAKRLTPLECLQIISVFRLILPDTQLFVCGGREENIAAEQKRIFDMGATGTMVGDYLTTKGNCVTTDHTVIRDGGYEIEPSSLANRK